MTPTISDEAVQAAEEAVYARHERGFLMKPLVDPIDMHAALTAALPFLQGVKVDVDTIVQPLEDIHAAGGLCKWTDVATAIGEVRRLLYAIEVAPSPRAQALETLEYVDRMFRLDLSKYIDWDGDNFNQAIFDTHQRVKSALSSQPVAEGLPQDVVNLVIAAREFWEDHYSDLPSSHALDEALEAFSNRVLYENEPDALPASPGASECCRDCDGYNCDDGCAFPVIPSARDLALEEAARLVENKSHIFHSRENTAASIRALSSHDHSLASGRSK